MPLQKTIPLNGSSVTASFWVPAALSVDFLTNDATVTLAGYVSAAQYAAGDKPIMRKSVRWVGSDNPITVARMQAGTAFAAALQKLTEAETRPMMPANPFAGGVVV